MQTKFFDSTGRQVDASIATDERGVIKPGFSMRTPVTMMDSASAWDSAKIVHPLNDADIRRDTRDPFKPLTDDEKSAAIDARNARLSDAWKNLTPLADTRTPLADMRTTMPVNNADDVDAAYDRYDAKLSDAWKAA
jgi:hypothetical protein